VCDAAYDNYASYFTHLIDTTCAKRKEAKELAARTAAAALSASQAVSLPAAAHITSRRGRPPGSVNMPGFRRASNNNNNNNINNNNKRLSPPSQQDEVQILERPTIQIRRDLTRAASPTLLANIKSADFQSRRFAVEHPPGSRTDETLAKRPRLSAPAEFSRSRFDFSQTATSSASNDPAPLNLSKRQEDQQRPRPSCYHVDVLTKPKIDLMEHAKDRARLEEVNLRALEILATLLGETQLAELGYPERVSASSLLAAVLKDNGRPASVADADCGHSSCVSAAAKVSESADLRKQLSFRRTKRELAAAEKNVRSLQLVYPKVNSNIANRP